MSARPGQTTWDCPSVNITGRTSSIRNSSFINNATVATQTGVPAQNDHQLSTKNLPAIPTKSITSQGVTSTLVAREGGLDARRSDASKDTKHYVDMIIDGALNLANLFKANQTVQIDHNYTASNTSTDLLLDNMSTDQSDRSNLLPSTTPGALPAACPTTQSALQTNIILLNTTTFQAPANKSSTSKMDEILPMSQQFYTWDKVAYYILATVYTIGQIIDILISMWKWVQERRARR